jgi:hypothetical protein
MVTTAKMLIGVTMKKPARRGVGPLGPAVKFDAVNCRQSSDQTEEQDEKVGVDQVAYEEAVEDGEDQGDRIRGQKSEQNRSKLDRQEEFNGVGIGKQEKTIVEAGGSG